MHAGVIALAMAVNLLSAVLFYLSAPRQQWLAGPLPARSTRWAASALLAVSLALWLTQAQVATSLFAVLTLTMILFSALPYLAAWRAIRRPQ
jgi:hypothetical protein